MRARAQGKMPRFREIFATAKRTPEGRDLCIAYDIAAGSIASSSS